MPMVHPFDSSGDFATAILSYNLPVLRRIIDETEKA